MTRLEQYLGFVVHDRRIRPPRRATRRWHHGPARDERYKAWIRTLPCEICGRHAQAAHTGNDGGMGEKPSDYTCIPLCAKCHITGKHAYHNSKMGKKAFEALHMINCEAVVQRLNAEYAQIARKVAI